jgi:WD repeat-containing protein 48
METPVLTLPPHTTVIIQEDNPESGGLADQYRGEISELGDDADTLEKIAPMWLGDLLLKVRTSCHDTSVHDLTAQRWV